MNNKQAIEFARISEKKHSAIVFYGAIPKKLGQCVVVEGDKEHHIADALTIRLGFNVNVIQMDDNNYLITLGDNTFNANIYFNVNMVSGRVLNSSN